MSPLKHSLLIVVLAGVAACGRQVVEFKLGNDASIDARADARSDGSVDGSSDGSMPDASMPDASMPDASMPDASMPDASMTDASMTDAPNLPPTVIATIPLNNATNVSINTNITARFSKPMLSASINTLTFTVHEGLNPPVAGVITLDSLTSTATLDPSMPLTAGLTYTATVTTGAMDTTGMSLAMNYTWMFTTGTGCVVAPVALGTAGNFAVLAGSTVTNTGLSSVTGDLGVSPGTAVTGFPPGVLVGTLQAGSTAAATAIADLDIAYRDAAGRTLCSVSVAGNLGGLTLAPGLYKSTSFLEISSGDLTLDGGGDSSAVWIFQMTSGLDVSSGRQVRLTNGASAANVFWQVGSSATLGVGAVFKGTIMADQAVSLATGVSLNGRALAHIAAVTLDASTVVKP